MLLFINYCVLFCAIISLSGNSFATELQCGNRPMAISSRTFGGYKISRNEWPWLVALIHAPLEAFFCGGSLISEQHVLSGEVVNDE